MSAYLLGDVRRSLVGALLASSALLAPSAMAQAAPAADAPTDIVVTAQKRSERLQDVPLAVTALSGETLANRQINDTAALVGAVPSLSYQQGNNPTNTTFRIRGIGTALFSQGVEPSVSVVVDGVVAARQAQNFTDLADIERIEVLRGPQGTLCGKYATAGVINVITARPSDKLEAQAGATIAQEGEYRVNGSISGPLSETVKARLSGYYNDVGGYAYDTKTNTRVNGSKGWGLRGKLEWDAASNLNFLLTGEYRKSNADCCNGILVQANNPARVTVNGTARIAANSNQVYNNDLTFANTSQATVSLEGNLDLGGAKITTITAYQDFFIANNFEADRLGYDTPVFIAPTAAAQWNYNYGTTHIRQFSQEARIASTGKGPLTWVAGGYYSHVELDRFFSRRRALCASGTLAQACTPGSYQSLASQANEVGTNISAFGQVEYKLFDKLKLIGGARLQHETNSVGGTSFIPVTGDAAFGGSTQPYARQRASDTALTGKTGLEYQFQRNAQAYFTYTRGYKGLGFNTELGTSFAMQNPVLPEYVNAYELGFKGATHDGKLTVAAALFLADYTNLQIQANRSDPTTGVISYTQTNAGSARTRGLELESTFRPVKNLSINASLTYMLARFDADGINCPTQYQAGAATYGLGAAHPVNTCYKYQYTNAAGALVTSGAVQDVRNGVLPVSPKWQVQVSPRYEHDLAGAWRGFVEADYSYRSRQGFAIEQDPLLQQGAYSLVDLSFGIYQPRGRVKLTAFVKNLFNRNFYTSLASSNLFPTNTNLLDLYANRPKEADRYMGLTLAVKL